MALIYCPKCSRSSADAIDQCPNCGAALGKHSPPATSLQAESDLNNDQGAQPPFFAVSLLKLIVLSIRTFGLYEIYWFWRNWNRIRVSGEPDITPSLRALFLIFYCYPCFFRIKQSGISHGVTPAPPIGILAIRYVLMTFSWRLPGPAGLIAFLSVAFFFPFRLM